VILFRRSERPSVWQCRADGYVLFLYWLGVQPYMAAKHFEKYPGELNPTMYITSLTVKRLPNLLCLWNHRRWRQAR